MVAPEGAGPLSQPSARRLTTPWPPSSGTTQALKGVLPMDYARPAVWTRPASGRLIDLISNIQIGGRADVPGQGRAGPGVRVLPLPVRPSAEGRKGGEFYTPRCVVRLLVEMLEPYNGRVYDPCCGSAGMFVQSMEFIQRTRQRATATAGRPRADISHLRPGVELHYVGGWPR